MNKSICELFAEAEHEKIVLVSDCEAGYRGIIAVHSTALGVAVGGTRFWPYASDAEASIDALRLARAMTYKNALAGLPFGGGKSVIIGDNQRADREGLFRAHGRFVESLGGIYITAEDVGTRPSDMEYVRLETSYVSGLAGKSGDPAPMTALGVLWAMRAAAKHSWGADELAGRTVALQGCGSTGYHLARELSSAGARLIVTDVDAARAMRVVEEFGAAAVAPDLIYDVAADIFAPCALGGVINDATTPRLKARIVAGSANNQLLDERHGDALREAGILYAPDYVANAGGVINGCRELLGWAPSTCLSRIEAIYDTTASVLEQAARENVSPARAADQMAELRISAGKADRRESGSLTSAATPAAGR